MPDADAAPEGGEAPANVGTEEASAKAGTEAPPVQATPDEIMALAKAEGNALLARANDNKKPLPERCELLEQAEAAYTRAIDADAARPFGIAGKSPHASTHIVLANRGQARLKLGGLLGVWSAPPKLRECIADCDAALLLSPSYVKARFRRARANIALASAPHADPGSSSQAAALSAAMQDLRLVLVNDPDNKEAQSWAEAAPRISRHFNGTRLPNSLAELSREIAKLDEAGSADHPSPTRRRQADFAAPAEHKARGAAERRERGLFGLLLLLGGVATLLLGAGAVPRPSWLAAWLDPPPPVEPPSFFESIASRLFKSPR